MSSNLIKLLGVGLFATALIGAFELGRRGSVADRDQPTSGQRMGPQTEPSGDRSPPDDPVDDDHETSPRPTSNLAPFETLNLEPSHPRVTFVDPQTGRGRMSLVVVGAPGIWPPATMTSERDGSLYLPDTDIETLRGQQSHHYEVMARASSNSLAYWDSISFSGSASTEDFSTRRLPLEVASAVSVQALDPAGRVVQGAEVRLSRKAIGFISLTKRTGPDGRAEFRSVPAGAYAVSADTSGRGKTRTTISHAPPETTSLTLETQSESELPEPRSSAEESTTKSREDGPQTVAVEINGLDVQKWRTVDLHWRRQGGEWKPGTVDASKPSGTHRWRRQLASGSYELRLVDEAGNSAHRNLEVGSDRTQFTWTVALERNVNVYVADRAGQPIDGALVQVWREDNQVDSGLSAGDTPLEFSLASDATYQLVAIDAGRGESTRRVNPSQLDGRDVVVEIDRPLFFSDRPPERVQQRDRLERLLGAPLVDDGNARLIDAVDPDSPALRSGLERGDRLMSLHQVEQGWEVIVERDGQIVTNRLLSPTGE